MNQPDDYMHADGCPAKIEGGACNCVIMEEIPIPDTVEEEIEHRRRRKQQERD